MLNLNKLKQDCIRLARGSNHIHALISNDVKNKNEEELNLDNPDLQLRVVNLYNSLVNPKYWVIEFIATKYSKDLVV